MRRTVWRVDRGLVWAFGKTLPAVNWAFFVTGLAGGIGTAAGLLPPFSGSWWARITTVLLWALFAREGYEPLAEDGEQKSEPLLIPSAPAPTL